MSVDKPNENKVRKELNFTIQINPGKEPKAIITVRLRADMIEKYNRLRDRLGISDQDFLSEMIEDTIDTTFDRLKKQRGAAVQAAAQKLLESADELNSTDGLVDKIVKDAAVSYAKPGSRKSGKRGQQ